jgi:putative transposase
MEALGLVEEWGLHWVPVVVAIFGWVYVTGKHNKVLDDLAASGDLKGDSFLLHCVNQHLIKTSRLIVVLITPADVYFGRGQSILKQRERIKRKTMETRRLQYRKYAA